MVIRDAFSACCRERRRVPYDASLQPHATLIGVVDDLSACDEQCECFLARRRQFTDFPLDACLDPVATWLDACTELFDVAGACTHCIEAFNQPLLSASGLAQQGAGESQRCGKGFPGDRPKISFDSRIESEYVSRGSHNGLLSVSLPSSLRRPAQRVAADERESHGRSDQLADPTAEIGGREALRAYALRYVHCKHRAKHRYAEGCTDHAGGIDETRCRARSGRRRIGHCHRTHRSEIETEATAHGE